MLYFSKEINPETVNSDEIITGFETDYTYERAVDLTNRIVLETEQKIAVEQKYKLVFFRFTEKFFKIITDSVNLFSDMKMWKSVHDSQKILLNTFNRRLGDFSQSCFFTVNLSFGDFCLLISENCYFDLNNILFWEEITPIFNTESYFKKTYYSDILKQKVLNKLESRHIFKYIPHYNYKTDIIERILNTNAGTAEKTSECARIASVLLHYFTDEAANLCFYADGDVKTIKTDVIIDSDKSYAELRRCICQFSEQASIDNIFYDTEWSFYNLSVCLLYSAFGKSYKTSSYDNRAEYDNFHGFIPVVSQQKETVNSFVPDKPGISYMLAFLELPYALTTDWYEKLPALLHEFSHYIPTINREKRNSAILRLTFSTVLNRPFQEILQKCPNGKIITEAFLNTVISRYNGLYKLTLKFDYDKSSNLQDSMFFSHQSFDLFEAIDFEDMYIRGYSIDGLPDNLTVIFKKHQEHCKKLWENFSNSYFITYMLALREIRSDIAMHLFLSSTANSVTDSCIKLKDYILLMASAPEWASGQASDTADSVLLRFGFMTRFLFASESEKRYTDSEEFNRDWYEKTNNIFDKIIKERRDIADTINIMRDYIGEYINITFDYEYDEDSQTYLKFGYSAFEKELLDIEDNTYFNIYSGIVGSWTEQFENIITRNSSFYNTLKELYAEYQEETDFKNRIVLNHQARLIFRDMQSFFPDLSFLY